MGGNRYTCKSCGFVAWQSGPRLCDKCGGEQRRASAADHVDVCVALCVICGKEFTPRTARIVACSPACSVVRAKRMGKDLRSGAREKITARPWEWLQQDIEMHSSRRKIIDVLSREYPWVDVLSGNAPAWSAM